MTVKREYRTTGVFPTRKEMKMLLKDSDYEYQKQMAIELLEVFLLEVVTTGKIGEGRIRRLKHFLGFESLKTYKWSSDINVLLNALDEQKAINDPISEEALERMSNIQSQLKDAGVERFIKVVKR
jgi:hypothetical protein